MSDKSKEEKKSENNNEINDGQDNCLQEISSENKTNENEKEVNDHQIKLINHKKVLRQAKGKNNQKTINDPDSNNGVLTDDNVIKKKEVIKEYICTKTLRGHQEKVVSLIKLESGYIASGSYECVINIWDIETEKIIKQKKESGYVFCLLEFEKDMLLSGTSENDINLWDTFYYGSSYIIGGSSVFYTWFEFWK